MIDNRIRPLYTVGIPTYNRSGCLNKCLDNVYSQIGNDEKFEVLVCDNNSSDETESIVLEYLKKYNNLIYIKNEENIGADRNFQKVLELARGEYVSIHGDDDYFRDGVYYEILKMITENRDCDVMFIPAGGNTFFVERGAGINEYILNACNVTGITGMILNNDSYKKIEDKEKFLYSKLNHMYLQLEMLTKNNNFCVLKGPVVRWDCASEGFSGYNVMEVIMKNYIDILNNFEGNGLTKKEIKYQKYFLLTTLLFPLIGWVINARMSLSLDGAVDLFTEYYSEEVYFDDRLIELKNMLARWYGDNQSYNTAKKKQILTIAIPTYNRGILLGKCLENIYSQVGNDENVEVLVCDNNSSDNTESIVAEYNKKYTNIVYYKNETNIGVSRNFQKALALAKGEYINLHGDDDYFKDGVYTEVLKMINLNRDCDVMYLTMKPHGLICKRGIGLSNYQLDSGTGGWVTGMIINSDAYKKIEDKEKFLDSNLNHIYIQLELLRRNPKYAVLVGSINRADTGDGGASGYNIMEVAIQNYLDILYSFKNNGLTEAEVSYHKLVSLDITFPLIKWIIQSRLPLSIDNGIEIFTKYYSDEPYFNIKLRELKGIFSLKNY